MLTIEDLQHIRTLARHGINETCQLLTVEQLNDATQSILKLDHVIDAIEQQSLKTVEIEQANVNIQHREQEHG